jgi:hypothetical protein
MGKCKSADDTSIYEEGAAMNDTRDTVGLDLSFMMGGGNDNRRDTRISEQEEVHESTQHGNLDQMFEFDHEECASEKSD